MKSLLLVFDLDNCILDTATQGEGSFKPVLDVLHRSKLPRDKKTEVERDFWTTALDDVLKKHGVGNHLSRALRSTQLTVTVLPDSPLRTYGDEHIIPQLPGRKVLLTSGYTAFQNSKLNHVGIRSMFEAIHIDALDDPKTRLGKKAILAELMEEYGCSPEDVVVIGDSGSSELSAGKALGMKTVQTLRPNVKKWDDADYHVENLQQLAELLQGMDLQR